MKSKLKAILAILFSLALILSLIACFPNNSGNEEEICQICDKETCFCFDFSDLDSVRKVLSLGNFTLYRSLPTDNSLLFAKFADNIVALGNDNGIYRYIFEDYYIDFKDETWVKLELEEDSELSRESHLNSVLGIFDIVGTQCTYNAQTNKYVQKWGLLLPSNSLAYVNDEIIFRREELYVFQSVAFIIKDFGTTTIGELPDFTDITD
ncbi:MAG: hypothetical protein FWD49_03775 [Firmicutes bacterium]|nr:hypothetical protein [Bacillota bacterium]